MNFREALYEARKMSRAAAVRYTIIRGYEAIELEDFDSMGRVDIVIPENGAPPVPQSDSASECLANMLYEQIGGLDWSNKFRPASVGPHASKPKKLKLRR